MSNCEFCDEFAGGQQNAYALLYGQTVSDRVILSTEGFRVVPSLGQIVEGHLLIIPKMHFCALADLPDKQIDELESLCHHVKLSLRNLYSKCVFFEHGIRKEGAGGCGIDHAHMHAVPIVADDVLTALMTTFGGCRLHRLDEIRRTVPRDSSYLFFEDSSEARYAFAVEHLPSQYMRRLIANQIGRADWDWRECGYEPKLISTVERLSPTLSHLTAHRG